MALLPARRHPSLRPARLARGLTLLALLAVPAAAHAGGPPPGSLEYLQRDNLNQADAYGRNTEQQLGNPAYMQALQADHGEAWLNQLAAQAATPTRLAITPGNVFPGWNGGEPPRRGRAGARGQRMPNKDTKPDGGPIPRPVFAPLPGA